MKMQNKLILLATTLFLFLLSACADNSSSSDSGSGSGTGSTQDTVTYTSSFSITKSGNDWKISANGIPLHPVSSTDFVNAYKAQSYSLTLNAQPSAAGSTTALSSQFPKAFGITLDGVKLDPLTAECYDASGTKQSNAQQSCTYRQDALQTIRDLKFDDYFGHSQPNTGAYHYHAYSNAAAKEIYKKYTGAYPADSVDLVLIGIARDGFPIYKSLKDTYTSRYALNNASRTGFDGSNSANGLYVQDYTYNASNSGNLDDCNGAAITKTDYSANGGFALDTGINYGYIVTERFKTGTTPNFPGIGHCFKGTVKSTDGF